MDQSDPSVFANDAAADTGAGHRESVFMLAQLRIDGRDEPIAVRVRNLSEGGLMAELPHPIPIDRAIDIELHGLGRIAGRIAWQTAGRIGVAFDTPVDPRRVRTPIDAKAVVPHPGG